MITLYLNVPNHYFSKNFETTKVEVTVMTDAPTLKSTILSFTDFKMI